MSTVVRWLLTALLSALAGSLAHVFEGSCPLTSSSWVCGHWDLVVSVATFVLAAFGVKVARKDQPVAQAKAGLRVVPTPAPETEIPDAIVVDGEGNPVAMGRAPEEAAEEPSGG